MSYQVGALEHFKENDPEFKSLESAMICAIAKSATGDSVIGVWTSQDEGSELVAIVYEQQVFKATYGYTKQPQTPLIKYREATQMNMILAPEFIENRLRPQIYKLAAERLIESSINDEYWIEAIAETLMGDGEIEPTTNESQIVISIVDQVLVDAREGRGHDTVLDLLLWHRYCYGDEESVSDQVVQTVMRLSKKPKKRRSRGKLPRSKRR